MSEMQEMSLADVLSQCGDAAERNMANSGFKVPAPGDWTLQLAAVTPGVYEDKKTGNPLPKLGLKFEVITAPTPELMVEFERGVYHVLKNGAFGDNTTLQKFAKCIDPTCGTGYAENAQLLAGAIGKAFVVRIGNRTIDNGMVFASLNPLSAA